jgi:biotin carboxyl carrier protein
MSATPPSPPASPRASFGGRWTYVVLVVALLFVLMPFLLWNATWFGRPLTDEQIGKSLSNRQHPREIQHALAQIETRMEARDPAVKRWYPQLVALARDPLSEIRLTDAWVMGQDNAASEFHQALLELLSDPQPMVQRNAALSLVRFHDSAGRPQILSLLRPYALPAPESGRLKTRLRIGDVVNAGTLVAHLEVGAGKREVRTSVPGTIERWLVSDAGAVSAGQPILLIAPSESMVYEALRALVLIGRPEDATAVEPYARAVEGMPPQVQRQATLTLQILRDRSRQP